MPYSHQYQSRQHFRRAVLTGVALAFLLLLLALAPARILSWSGVGFGSLTVPEQATVAEQVSVARPAAETPIPPAIEPLTFPEYAEWGDLETSCAECDLSLSYSLGGPLDAVDADSLDRLERSAQLTSSAVGASGHGSGAQSFAGGSGGAGGGGAAGAETSEAVSEAPVTAEAEEAAESDSVEAAAQATEGPAASAGTGGGSSDSGSFASDATDASFSADSNLVLSPIAGSDGSSGGSPAVDAAPQEVVQALAEGPVGSETVHALAEPDAIEALLEDDSAAAAESGTIAQEQTVPEPTSLMLLGLALSALLYRLRRVVRP